MTTATTGAANPSPLICALESTYRRRDTKTGPDLRRALRLLPQVPDAQVWAYVAPYVGRSTAAQDTGLLTAALWAHWHNGYVAPVNGALDVGGAVRRAYPYDTHDKAYTALTRADWATLPRILGPVVGKLADARTALDWTRLQRDLRAWREGNRDAVLKRWSMSLYNPLTASIAPTAATTTTTDTVKETA